jgi:RNA polymerase sigma-70 factor, ECF subfamily
LDQLARAAQAGQPRAFDQLATALLPRIRRWALAHVPSADDAEDIAQEVLLKAHRSLADFGFGSRFTTWIYAVTRRTAADWHRKRHRRTTLMAVHLAEPVEVSATQMEPDSAALTALIRKEFQKLPNRQREVFDLADLQGLPLTEIADMLGMNPITARVHLHRARAAIRSRILQSHPALVEDL